jgi:VWFA-related protein
MLRCLIAAFFLLQVSMGSPAAAQTTAPEILRQVRQTYSQIKTYRDHGVVQVTAGEGAAARTTRRLFDLVANAAGEFQLILAPEDDDARRETFWRTGGKSYRFDSARGEYALVPSLAAELAKLVGEGGLDAFAVPVFLAGGEDALSDPETAVLERSEPCGPSDCWVVALSRMGGAVLSRVWVDTRTALIYKIEVRLGSPGDVMDQAMSEAGLAVRQPAAAPAGGRTIVVQHEVEQVDGTLRSFADLGLMPPEDATLVERIEPSGDDLADFGEEITVSVSTVVVRVVDDAGKPVLGLKPEDFRVVARRKEIPVVAVDWVGPEHQPPGPPGEREVPAQALGDPDAADPYVIMIPPAAAPVPPEVVPAGKTVIFFVQGDLHPSRARGQLKMRPHTADLLKTFGSEDRMAVVSFDSHLKLRQDFTRDRQAVHKAIDRAMLFGGPALTKPSRDPAMIAAYLDFDRARDVASPEAALLVLGETLRKLPGDKVMVYLGHGFGRFAFGRLRMRAEYLPAVEALQAAQVTVFSMDVTQADYHTLEAGMQLVAAATGGSYYRTYQFPGLMTEQLAATLSGHYVLTLDPSALPEDGGTVRIGLQPGKKGTVMAREIRLKNSGGR